MLKQRSVVWSGRPIASALLYLSITFFLVGCGSTSGEFLRGGYEMSREELNMHCGALDNAIEVIITRIGALQATVTSENSIVAPTLTRFWIRVTEGDGKDSPYLREIARERERAIGYNARLLTKGCSPIDLEARLGAS